MKWIAEFMSQQLFATGLPVRLHVRHDLHLARKIWHMSMGLLMASIYLAGMSASLAVFILAGLLAFSLATEMLRLRIPSINERVVRFLCPIMRTCEVNRVSGVPYYLLSTLLAIAIFPKAVAVLSILFLAFGDPVASLVGILYGNHGRRFSSGKSLIGTVAGVSVCFLLAFLYLKTLGLSDWQVLPIAIIGGAVGGGAEHLPLETDDNFSIPMVSGFVLWLTFILFGI